MIRSRVARWYAPLGAAALAGATVPVALASPAQAHQSTTYTGVGADRGSVSSSHTVFTACNTVIDGHTVTTVINTSTGRADSVSDGTVNGVCTGKTLPSGEFVVQYKVCTVDVVCSPWQPA